MSGEDIHGLSQAEKSRTVERFFVGRVENAHQFIPIRFLIRFNGDAFGPLRFRFVSSGGKRPLQVAQQRKFGERRVKKGITKKGLTRFEQSLREINPAYRQFKAGVVDDAGD